MVTVLYKMKKNMYYIASQPRSSLHWTILVLFCTMKYVSFNSFLNACSVNINANINSFYWLNYGHTSSNKGTSGFRSNTLLMRIQQMLLWGIMSPSSRLSSSLHIIPSQSHIKLTLYLSLSPNNVILLARSLPLNKLCSTKLPWNYIN